MATNLEVCAIDGALKEKLNKFRFRKEKNNAAIVMKIIPDKLLIVEDPTIDEEDLVDISVEDLVAELPSHQPRFIAFSYCLNHDDGRVSYPLCFLYITPQGSKPELHMMYAGSKLTVVNQCQFTKVFEFRSLEDLTEEFIISKLKR